MQKSTQFHAPDVINTGIIFDERMISVALVMRVNGKITGRNITTFIPLKNRLTKFSPKSVVIDDGNGCTREYREFRRAHNASKWLAKQI